MAAFEGAQSKGAAWNMIRNAPGVEGVGKLNGAGELVPRIKPRAMQSASPEDEAEPAASPAPAAAAPAKPTPAKLPQPSGQDMTATLQEMLDQVTKKKPSGSVMRRLLKGEAGQLGWPGSVTEADEGISDIESRPVLSQKTGSVPARGFLQKVGADENSVLKTQKDLDSVFYHRQQIAKNGAPSVDLHVDEGGNVIGAQGRHRAVAAIQQGGPNAKVNVTIYRHAYENPE